MSVPVWKNGRISVSTGKFVESARVPGKGGIPASTEKLSGPVRKNGRISVSTEKLLNPGEYRKTVLTNSETWLNQYESEKLLNPREYQEDVESMRVPKTVRTSTEKW